MAGEPAAGAQPVRLRPLHSRQGHRTLTDLGHDLADEHVRKVVRRRLTEGGNGDRQLPPGRP